MRSHPAPGLLVSAALLALTASAQTYTLTALNAQAGFSPNTTGAQGTQTTSPGGATYTASLGGQTVNGTMAISGPASITGTISTVQAQSGATFRVLKPTTPQPFTITWTLSGPAQQANLVAFVGVNFTRQTTTATSLTFSPTELVLTGTDDVGYLSATVGFRFPSTPNTEVTFNIQFQWAVAAGAPSGQTTTYPMIPQYPKPQPSTQGSSVRNLVLTPSPGSLAISFSDAQNRTYSGRLDVATQPTVTGTKAAGASVVVLSQPANFTTRWTFGDSANLTVATTFNQFIPGTSCTGTAGNLNCVIAKDGFLSVLDNGDLAALVTLDLQTAGGGGAYKETWVFSWGATAPPTCPSNGTVAGGVAGLAAASPQGGQSAGSRAATCPAVNPGISVDFAVPLPSERLIALSDTLPPFCGFGEYTSPTTNPVEIVLQLVDDRGITVAASRGKEFPPGSKLQWGGNCFTDKDPMIIQEFPMPQFVIPPDAGVAQVLGKLHLQATMTDAITRKSMQVSSSIDYSVIPGVSLTNTRLYISKGVAETGLLGFLSDEKKVPVPPGKPILSPGSLGSLLAGITLDDYQGGEYGVTLETDVLLGTVGDATLTVRLYAVNSERILVAYSSSAPKVVPISFGASSPKVPLNERVEGQLSEILFELVITFTGTGQTARFPGPSIPVEQLSFVRFSPEDSACSLGRSCPVKNATNDFDGQLSVTPIAPGSRVVRTVKIAFPGRNFVDDPTPGVVVPTTLPAFKTTLVSDPFKVALPREADAVLISYALKHANEPDTFCLLCPSISKLFFLTSPGADLGASAINGLQELASSDVTVLQTTLNKKIQNVKSPMGLGPILASTGPDSKKFSGSPATVTNPPFLGISSVWIFDSTVPRDGSLSARLTLRYEASDLPDDPNFVESRLQMVSIDSSGALRIYPTTLDPRTRSATALIDSLDTYYSLAVVGPLQTSVIRFSEALRGYALVNTGSQDANLKVTAYAAEGIGRTPDSSPLKAASLVKYGPAGSLSVSSASFSIRGASWFDSGRLLAVAPSVAPSLVFAFTDVEYASRRYTELHWSNTTSFLALTKVSLFGADGLSAGVAPVTLEPRASASTRIDSLFPGLPKDFVGYAVLSSNQPVVAFAAQINSSAATTISAQPITDANLDITTRYGMRLGETDSAATLHLVNFGSALARLTLRARGVSGSAAGSAVSVNLPAGAQYTKSLSDIFGLAADSIGSIQVDSTTRSVLGDVFTVNSAVNPTSAISIPLTADLQKSLVLPYATESTAVYVFNPNSAPAEVGATAYASDGTRGSTSSVTIPAFGRGSVQVASTGYVGIASSQTIVAVGVLTTPTSGVSGYLALPSDSVAAPPQGGGTKPAGTAAGVLNAASYQGGTVAAGEIVTIFGSNFGPGSLAGLQLVNGRVSTDIGQTRVLFDNVPAAIVYVVTGQASIIVPYSVAGKATTQLVMEYQGRRSDPITLNVAQAAPGLFSANASGSGPGAILNQNGQVNTPQNPAQRGSVVVLFGTGEGITNPAVPDGSVTGGIVQPILPVTVTIGGVAQKVLYAGAAPGLIAGVLQVNVEIVANTPGGNQDVVVTVGTISSQSGLTVTIAGGAVTQPTISVAPTSLDFGSVQSGQTRDLSIRIGNPGNAALTVTGVVSSSAQFQHVSPTTPFNIAAGAFQDVTIRFAPTAAGTFSGTLAISSNDPARPSTSVSLTGTGTPAPTAAPAIVLDPSSMDFGSVAVGQTKDLAITVRNNGTSGLSVTSVVSSNPNFVLLNFSPFGVGAGSFQIGTVRFSPTAPGLQTGTLTFSSNDPAHPSAILTVSGTGTSGGSTGSNLLCNGSFEQPGHSTGYITLGIGGNLPCWNITAGNIDVVGTVWQHSDGKFSLDMDGDTPGTITQVFSTVAGTTYTVAFDMAGNPGGGSAQKQLQVSAAGQNSLKSFTTTGRSVSNMGWQRQTFTFTANSASTTLQFMSLSAAGSNAGPALDNVCVAAGTTACTGSPGGGGTSAPTISVSATSLAFGSVIVNQNKDLSVQVSNSGTAALTVNANVAGTGFVLTGAASFTIQPGAAAQTVTVRYSPASAAAALGTLTLASNDPARPSTAISLTGTGTAAGGGGGTSTRVTVTTVAGWPNGRTSNQPPALAIDGSTATFTWTTESNNSINPSFLGIGFAALSSVNRIRLYKDNNAGGPGLIAKNLTIEYTTSDPSVPLASRTWTLVSGLTNGFGGVELLNASAVNANGTVTADNHDSFTSGFASLSFTGVNATGIRIGFSNVSTICCNHYRVYEFEAYGGGAGPSQGNSITFGQTISGTLSPASGHSVDCVTCYADVYTLTVTARRAIDIRLNSTAFDAFLNLLDLSNQIIFNDDDGGGGFNSRIFGTIEPGTYRIEVTSAGPGESGAYSITISP